MLRIRRARAGDEPGILAAHTAAIRVTCRSHYSADDVELWAGRLTVESYDDAMTRRDALVVEEDGRVLGFGVLDVEGAELRAVYVHPDAAGRSLGRRLLAALEAIARLRGLRDVRLDSSLNAIGFYTAAGWQRVGSSCRTYPGGRDIPCGAMTKTLRELRFDVRDEAPGDVAAIDAVERAAFERADEAALVACLRREGALALSLVACLDGVVVGHAALSPVRVDGASRGMVGLAPVAVDPPLQRCAIGARLVEESLARARGRDVGGVVVLGHPAYYPRFGFVPASRFGLRFSAAVPEDAFMVAELVDGALARAAGVVRYHTAFDAIA
jgi:putative acetyltransferase